MKRLSDTADFARRGRPEQILRLLGLASALLVQGCAAFCLPVDRPSQGRDYLATLYYDTTAYKDHQGLYQIRYDISVDGIVTTLRKRWRGRPFQSLAAVHDFAKRYRLECDDPAAANQSVSCRYIAYREGDPVMSFPKCEYDVIATIVDFTADPQGGYRISDVRAETSTLVVPRGTVVRG